MEDVIYEADPNSTGAVTITTFFIHAATTKMVAL
jgi:hypothetical protein